MLSVFGWFIWASSSSPSLTSWKTPKTPLKTAIHTECVRNNWQRPVELLAPRVCINSTGHRQLFHLFWGYHTPKWCRYSDQSYLECVNYLSLAGSTLAMRFPENNCNVRKPPLQFFHFRSWQVWQKVSSERRLLLLKMILARFSPHIILLYM